MKRSGSLLLYIIFSFILHASIIKAKLPAFPSAEGFGKYTKGGRGGKVYFVNNLKDRGKGSLRAAVEASGPRTVIFRVSGNIPLKSDLEIYNPYITIAGQTAPGDGICLKYYPLKVRASHVIVRYIRSRLGAKAGRPCDSLSVAKGKNIILDHCSASWSVDETLSVSAPNGIDMVTVQWCIVSEPLNDSVHHKGPHGYASLIRGGFGAKYSFHHNLYAHFKSRGPRPGNYNSRKKDPKGFLFDWRNNVIYNWGGDHAGYNSDKDSVSKYNFINNYYLSGTNSDKSIFFKESCEYAWMYIKGNYMNHKKPIDQWALVSDEGFKNPLSSEIKVYNVDTQSAPRAYASVLKGAGAVTYNIKRDKVDTRIVKDVKKKRGRVINDESEVGGWPKLSSRKPCRDRDKDGMPDLWEKNRGLNPSSPLDRNLTQYSNGYTRLEEYLQFVITNKNRCGQP